MTDIADFDTLELRYYSAICAQLQTEHEAGDVESVRLSLEEIEAIQLHTENALLRRRCNTTLTTWRTQRLAS